MSREACGVTASGKPSQFKTFLQINLIMTVQAYAAMQFNLPSAFKSVVEPKDSMIFLLLFKHDKVAKLKIYLLSNI